MMKKWVMMGLAGLLAASVQAEPIRTALTKENRLPRLYQAEAGVEFTYLEYEFAELAATTPYIRYTLLRDFVLFGGVPFLNAKPDFGSSESGFGDAFAGFEFVPYKDLFGYPWIMLHGEVSFPTGDEDKGLGSGDNEYMIGLAAGTTVHRVFHYVADARYWVLEDQDNIPSLAVSLTWDLDERFALIGEIELSREKEAFDEDTHPIIFLVGMHYEATRALQFSLHGGTSNNSDIDVIIRSQVSYSF